jgi:hypothetical protein
VTAIFFCSPCCLCTIKVFLVSIHELEWTCCKPGFCIIRTFSLFVLKIVSSELLLFLLPVYCFRLLRLFPPVGHCVVVERIMDGLRVNPKSDIHMSKYGFHLIKLLFLYSWAKIKKLGSDNVFQLAFLTNCRSDFCIKLCVYGEIRIFEQMSRKLTLWSCDDPSSAWALSYIMR